MKALSIRQPWAWMILNPYFRRLKTIETRNWKAPESVLGEEIIIHAGKNFDYEAYRILKYKSYLKRLPDKKEMPLGALCGIVRLEYCKPYYSIQAFADDEEKHFCDHYYFQPTKYGFVFSGGYKRFKKPIPYLGKLGFFDVPDEALRVCRVCGCSEFNACEGGCAWVEEDLCSKC